MKRRHRGLWEWLQPQPHLRVTLADNSTLDVVIPSGNNFTIEGDVKKIECLKRIFVDQCWGLVWAVENRDTVQEIILQIALRENDELIDLERYRDEEMPGDPGLPDKVIQGQTLEYDEQTMFVVAADKYYVSLRSTEVLDWIYDNFPNAKITVVNDTAMADYLEYRKRVDAKRAEEAKKKKPRSKKKPTSKKRKPPSGKKRPTIDMPTSRKSKPKTSAKKR